MMRITKAGILVLLAAGLAPAATHAKEKPRLILQITVDQLSGDLPTRHLSQFGEATAVSYLSGTSKTVQRLSKMHISLRDSQYFAEIRSGHKFRKRIAAE